MGIFYLSNQGNKACVYVISCVFNFSTIIIITEYFIIIIIIISKPIILLLMEIKMDYDDDNE